MCAIYEVDGRRPKISNKETYISPSADIIGDVTIGDNCFIGPGARIKGDYGKIVIGDRNSIQENCILHARPGELLTVRNDVTVGHGAILHNCVIRDGVVVGMGAIVSDYAIVNENAVIGEGAVVRQHQEIPADNVAVGVPAKVIGPVKAGIREELNRFKGVYVELARKYINTAKKISD
ncbi:MAG: gamma carbonic anhydrase family protein [Candidatus Hodarchaeales archaeon]